MRIPSDYPVQPLGPNEHPRGSATCGSCGLSWDDNKITSMTPVPSGRCPFEYFHETRERALFIPLCRKWFNCFANGNKTCEYRPYGPRWNERTCAVGRKVTLSLGYGKQHRLYGVVKEFWKIDNVDKLVGWREVYPDNNGPAACIVINLY